MGIKKIFHYAITKGTYLTLNTATLLAGGSSIYFFSENQTREGFIMAGAALSSQILKYYFKREGKKIEEIREHIKRCDAVLKQGNALLKKDLLENPPEEVHLEDVIIKDYPQL